MILMVYIEQSISTLIQQQRVITTFTFWIKGQEILLQMELHPIKYIWTTIFFLIEVIVLQLVHYSRLQCSWIEIIQKMEITLDCSMMKTKLRLHYLKRVRYLGQKKMVIFILMVDSHWMVYLKPMVTLLQEASYIPKKMVRLQIELQLKSMQTLQYQI